MKKWASIPCSFLLLSPMQQLPFCKPQLKLNVATLYITLTGKCVLPVNICFSTPFSELLVNSSWISKHSLKCHWEIHWSLSPSCLYHLNVGSFGSHFNTNNASANIELICSTVVSIGASSTIISLLPTIYCNKHRTFILAVASCHNYRHWDFLGMSESH